mgnify:CR=1 FL=1|jgi:hypothetical protein
MLNKVDVPFVIVISWTSRRSPLGLAVAALEDRDLGLSAEAGVPVVLARTRARLSEILVQASVNVLSGLLSAAE